MKGERPPGFTLIELVVAVFLSSIVMMGLSSILTPLVMSQVYSARAQTVQLNLAAIEGLVERELRQASVVTRPSGVGSSGVLEGCANAAPKTFAAIDAAAPVSWFAFCASGGVVDYHSGAGCPAAYTCGASPTAEFRWPNPWSSLQFIRSSAATTLITAVLQGSSGNGDVVTSTTAVSFSAPAGGAQ